ncbi:uncharacterized protein LOC111329328 [Stylophora pistillata]|nr:uncharacterized protein LOC111329328 [Stylophora pistillata]
MNTRSQVPRGNKLFLPKIEYAKLTEDRPLGEERSNMKTVLSDEKKSNGESETEEKIPLLNVNMGAFTRFSVLPPIKNNARHGSRLSNARRFSVVSSNGSAASYDTSRKSDEGKLYKNVDCSSFVAQQRKDSSGEYDKYLQVVGRPYLAEKRKRRGKEQLRSKPRIPERSFSSPAGSESGKSSCKGCNALLIRQRSKTEGGQFLMDSQSRADIVKHTCIRSEEFSGTNQERLYPNSLHLQSEHRAYEKNNNRIQSGRRKGSTIATKQSEKISLSVAALANGRRPVSRCEIDLNINSSVSFEQDTHVSNEQRSNSPPSVRIYESQRKNSNENRDQSEDTAYSLQGMPQIKILIDSLENAREELPKGSIDVPYTSLREKRRRSALCRNNSKQVDDFLLVHNLRDLGLL